MTWPTNTSSPQKLLQAIRLYSTRAYVSVALTSFALFFSQKVRKRLLNSQFFHLFFFRVVAQTFETSDKFLPNFIRELDYWRNPNTVLSHFLQSVIPTWWTRGRVRRNATLAPLTWGGGSVCATSSLRTSTPKGTREILFSKTSKSDLCTICLPVRWVSGQR